MNSPQLELFSTYEHRPTITDFETGAQLRDMGIDRAVTHANEATPSWSDQAFDFLTRYITDASEFMAEDVRLAAKGIVPEPPSLRAWGSVMMKAAKSGLIKRVGYRSVSNPLAHATPAAIWKPVV